MDDGDGYPVVQQRKYGVLKKKKRVEDMEPEPTFVAQQTSRGGHGVLKKKKQKMVEVGHIEANYEPPVYDPPLPVYDHPRSGVLKKRKMSKPPRPNLVLRGMIFGNAGGFSVFVFAFVFLQLCESSRVDSLTHEVIFANFLLILR
jgi:hypothetical protein